VLLSSFPFGLIAWLLFSLDTFLGTKATFFSVSGKLFIYILDPTWYLSEISAERL
jgi:hypothetical protein